MHPARPDSLQRSRLALRRVAWVVAVLACGTSAALAQPAPSATSGRPVPKVTEGTPWSSLSQSQQQALRPLEAEWGRIDSPRRSKWIDIANKFPSMPPAEQARIQNRMAEWAKMTPPERGQARLNFREAQQVPVQERKAKWEAYNALPPEQRQQLAAKAAPVPPARRPATEGAVATSPLKSNVVPNPSYAPKPKPVAPTVAQAQPGATTNLITKRPNPPAHQPAGLPKIAVTPGFVDQSTLLPKRGPQGAATRSAAAPASAPARQ
ncbi:DUF3106 domain-containing protein [Piscinibacter sp. HJYY11]|uniref:DUF3106 domain-containing protein n=1 Tax=Piscinibacter sp. HJYY11 TaxID=2801333 RepID=UPI00191D794C|nr:DUF3106 domain-containing protein [Piscinibacter sp. HJYY11]MBL0726826.1 DUF3106 domain-containing protein [Piscinibacter sp. HJYY11]